MKKEVERNIERENEIINNVVENVKKMYVKERLNNIGNSYTYFLSLFDRIKTHTYSFQDEDGIMSEFNHYLDGFENSESGDNKCRAAINHFIKEVDAKLREFENQITTEIKERNITTLKGLMKFGEEKLNEYL